VTVVIEDDGTVVDDEKFFKKLPAQTVFVFLKTGEQWRGGKHKNIHVDGILQLSTYYIPDIVKMTSKNNSYIIFHRNRVIF